MREIYDQLRDCAVASRHNKPIGEKMILNAAFLVEREKQAEFDSAVQEIAARYEGKLALLEYEPGKGYLPVSAANPQGVRYADLTVRLDPSGWLVRLVEVGAYKFLLELEPVRLNDLTVHHLA